MNSEGLPILFKIRIRHPFRRPVFKAEETFGTPCATQRYRDIIQRIEREIADSGKNIVFAVDADRQKTAVAADHHRQSAARNPGKKAAQPFLPRRVFESPAEPGDFQRENDDPSAERICKRRRPRENPLEIRIDEFGDLLRAGKRLQNGG